MHLQKRIFSYLVVGLKYFVYSNIAQE